MPKKKDRGALKPDRKLLPIEIPYPQNVPLDMGAVFIVLPTLDELDSFWKANRDRLPYAATNGITGGEPIYLREYEWIFAPTITSLVKAVTRWDQLGIRPKWYDWKTDEPDLYTACSEDFKRHRRFEIEAGTWTEKDEVEFQKNQASTGWWILENLPERVTGTPTEVFSDWIGEWHDTISDRTMPPEAVAELMQNEFFKSWRYDAAADGDVTLYDRAEMDENVSYWKRERRCKQAYYGCENELCPRRTV
jgi:hypothetical protein